MTTLHEVESALEVYSLEDILELNDLSSSDALLFLVEEEFLELPDVKLLDLS